MNATQSTRYVIRFADGELAKNCNGVRTFKSAANAERERAGKARRDIVMGPRYATAKVEPR